MTFHLYTLINLFLIAYLGQEVKLYSKGIKRSKRLILLSVFSVLSFFGVILFDILSLKNIATLIYDIVMSVFIFFLLYSRNVDNYKIMQRVHKKKQVKRLNYIFYSIIIFMLIFPFVFFGVFSLINDQKDFFISNQAMPYFVLGVFAYLGLIFAVVVFFSLKYYKYYKIQVSEDEEQESKTECK